MANQNNAPAPDKNEMRIMWIASAVIVVLLLGGMGINMLVTTQPSADSTEFSSQSRTEAPK